MRKALIGLLMAATAATPLLAQNDERGHDRGGQHSQQQGQQRPQQQRTQGQRQSGGNRGTPQPQQFQQRRQFQQPQQFQPQQRFQGRQFQAQPQQQQQQQQRNLGGRQGGWQGQGFRGGAGQNGFAPQAGRQQRQGWQGGNRGERGGAGWDRGWRNNGRYDWQRYRYENRRAFHLGPYYAPYRGYYYNPLDIGIVLDSLFYDRNYWIDPGYYDLPPAPPGAEWIRYYNDVVLVDVYSGQVIDVIHDFFW
jgi:hypothetical protein